MSPASALNRINPASPSPPRSPAWPCLADHPPDPWALLELWRLSMHRKLLWRLRQLEQSELSRSWRGLMNRGRAKYPSVDVVRQKSGDPHSEYTLSGFSGPVVALVEGGMANVRCSMDGRASDRVLVVKGKSKTSSARSRPRPKGRRGREGRAGLERQFDSGLYAIWN